MVGQTRRSQAANEPPELRVPSSTVVFSPLHSTAGRPTDSRIMARVNENYLKLKRHDAVRIVEPTEKKEEQEVADDKPKR